MMTRGIKHDVDRFINELSAKYLPFKYQSTTDKKLKDYMLQVSVRPVQLWEIAVPKEHQDIMLRTLFKTQPIRKEYGWMKKYIWAFRKALGLKPIPKYPAGEVLPVFDANVDKIAIGIKDDYYFANGVEGI